MAKGSKTDKEAKAAAKAARKQASKERRTQLWQAFQIQRKEDKALLPWMIGALVASIVVFFVIGLIFDIHWFLLPIASSSVSSQRSSSSAVAFRSPSTRRPTVRQARQRGPSTTFRVRGVSRRPSRAPPTSTRCIE